MTCMYMAQKTVKSTSQSFPSPLLIRFPPQRRPLLEFFQKIFVPHPSISIM